MRISFALKTLLTPLLALLLLAGCVAPATSPLPVPSGEAGSVAVSVSMPSSGYRSQHLLTDIGSLVFGLVDVSNDPYFGYHSDGRTLPEDGASHAYHPAIAGDGTAGSGLLSGIGLDAAEQARTKRYLYAATSNRNFRTMTFKNVRPSSTARYVAFVAAFNQIATETTVSKADAIGFTNSQAFSVADDGTTTVSMPPMVLDLGLGELLVTVDFNPAALLSSMDRLVIAVADVSAPGTRTPHLGYEIHGGATRPFDGSATADPAYAYHRAIAGYDDGDGNGFLQRAFNYTGTPISTNVDERGKSNRFLYYVETSTLGNVGQRAVVFRNLKAGGDYRVIALAFDGGDDFANIKGSTQSVNVTIAAGQQANTYLQLTLSN